MNKSKLLFVAATFVLLALLPLMAGQYGVDLVTKIMVFAIFALSLELLVGVPGQVAARLSGRPIGARGTAAAEEAPHG